MILTLNIRNIQQSLQK